MCFSCRSDLKLIFIDQTNPSTAASSAVLVNPDTEIYVAPRPRNSKAPTEKVINPTSNTAGSSKSKSKGKEKAMKIRVIPQRVAAGWGRPPGGRGDIDVIGWVSSETYERVGRRLGVKGEYLPVRMKKRRKKGDDVAGGDGGEAKQSGDGVEQVDKEEYVELWLAEWDEMPEGIMVLQGVDDKVQDSWFQAE